MKKYICLLLTMCSVFTLLFSCAKNTQEKEVNNLYYFHLEQGVLKKTNLCTEVTTFVCDDPLCKHNGDCKFSNAHTPTLIGKTLYFYRDAGLFIRNNIAYAMTQICSYNYVSGVYTVLCEITHTNNENVCGKFQIYDGFLYYYQQVVLDNDSQDQDTISFSMRRINIESKEQETFSWHNTMWHFAIYHDRLYFSDPVDGIFSTDMNFNDRQYIIKPKENTLIYARRIDSEGNIYYVETQGGEDTKTDTLMKYDVLTNTSCILDSSNSIIYVHVIDNRVYYLKGYGDGGTYVTYEPSLYVWSNNETNILYTASKDLRSLNACGTYLIVEQNDGRKIIIDTANITT